MGVAGSGVREFCAENDEVYMERIFPMCLSYLMSIISYLSSGCLP